MIYDVVKVQKSREQLFITIPKDIAVTLNIKKGSRIAYYLSSDGKIELKLAKEDGVGRE